MLLYHSYLLQLPFAHSACSGFSSRYSDSLLEKSLCNQDRSSLHCWQHSSLPSPHHGQSHSLPASWPPVHCSPDSCIYHTGISWSLYPGNTRLPVWLYPGLPLHQCTAVLSCRTIFIDQFFSKRMPHRSSFFCKNFRSILFLQRSLQ